MLKQTHEILQTRSEMAIDRGNKFPGYLGFNPEDYSKEQLIMMLNIIYDELQRTKNENIATSGFGIPTENGFKLISLK